MLITNHNTDHLVWTI